MTIPTDFVASWKFLHPKDIWERLEKLRADREAEAKANTGPTVGGALIIRNEIPPADLHVYLGARFGKPNGLQNFLRRDDSDNLIHWEWTLATPTGMVSFQGMNFRTEIWFHGEKPLSEEDVPELVKQIKLDFANYGKQMSEIRKGLEDWTEFVNPYQRIDSAIEKLLAEINSLDLKPEDEKLPDISAAQPVDLESWKDMSVKYSKGLGLCFGVRSMLPVLAESYVNLLMFVLLKPDLKSDERLRENAIRQPIDIRIKRLHIDCIGFQKAVDYSSEPCKMYHSLVNERNDLLHGNVVIDKLRFSEVYFNEKVPIFKEYRSMWERSMGVEIQAVGLHRLYNEVKVVKDLIEYLNGCLIPSVRKQFELMAAKRELGYNKKTGRVGILFPDHWVDFMAVLETKDGQQIDITGRPVNVRHPNPNPT